MSSQKVSLTPGQLVADALARFWVNDSRSDLTLEQFDEITPLLHGSGAGGLGWWQIRNSELRHTASGELLHQAFRLLVLQAAIHEAKIEKTFNTLREQGIEPIVIKGWAVARTYPRAALRAYGDIDLIVRHRELARANDIAKANLRECLLDFHSSPFELADRRTEDLFARSQLVACGNVQVRVLCQEDHFALLAIHLLKHGAWRPLWLCDLAMMLASMSADFAWNLCLGADPRRANWILAAVGLAQRLLAAPIKNEDIAARAGAVPPWLVERVLRAWDTPFAIMQAPQRHRAPISSYLRQPRGLLADLARRWPDPIVATITVNGTFGARRRKRYEIGNWLLRAGRIAGVGTGRAFEHQPDS